MKNVKRVKNLLLLLGGVFLTACSSTATQGLGDSGESLVQYVEPRIGTAHCRWFHFAPGALPFGMAKPASSTNGSLGNKSGWEATGYDYRDTSIDGFPCFHEFQVGGIVLMPTVGTLKTVPGAANAKGEGYRSSFSHDDEVATAGYYSVLLKDYDVKAELTATQRVAFQRYTFPESKQSRILFDIGNRQGESGRVIDAEVTVCNQNTVEGWVKTLPEYSNKYQAGATVTMYFSAQMDKEADAYGTFLKKEVKEGNQHVEGEGAGVYFTYSTDAGETITAKVGLSYTSVANARLNREEETNHGRLTFDEAKETSLKTWEDYLSRIRVETSVREDKVKFYTGLYHAILGRGLASDVNGAYPRNDGTTGQIPMKDGKPEFAFYNSDAVWGAQWNLVQVWALAYPEYLSDYVSTHLQVYKDAGWLADGIACSRYVSGVGTNQVSNVIAAAYLCGIRDFDVKTAYEAALKNELDGKNRPMGAGKMDTELFVKYGYVPHKDQGPKPDEAWMFSASHTLEYSYGAYAVAQMAKAMNRTDDYHRLMDLSKGWERLYNEKTNLIQPRWENGKFIDNFDPLQVWRGFQEGNSYQYTFYVPHDAKGLIAKMGTDEFATRLDSIFIVSQDKIFSGGTTIGAFAGLNTYYNQGNQPCLHISWLFNEAGKYALTQKWVRAILDEFYGTDGIHGYGYGQDEDQGQLGAWYVISSIGLFDVKGLASEEPTFAIGRTLFDKVTIKLNEKYYPGKQFVIEASNNNKKNVYVNQFQLNGKNLDEPRIKFKEVVSGGKLTVSMSETPAK